MKRVREAEELGENLRTDRKQTEQTGEVGTDRDPRLTLSSRVQSWRLWV